MAFCLTKQFAEKFKQMIKSGEINIDKLIDMSSKERNKYFSDLFGERNGKEINALFESKLLLKYQKKGLVNWAKQVTGIKPEIRNTLIDKIQKMNEILSEKNEKIFLQDLISKKIGTEITIKEAYKITELSRKISELEDYKTDKERITYGRARMELNDYINSLNPQKANLLVNVVNIPRSLMASLDLSAPLNQGWGMLSRKQFYSSFKNMFKYLKSDENLKNLQADIITRENYKKAKKSGLRLTELGEKLELREEQFMSNLLDKIPGIKASQRAYTGFLNKLRMDVFDDLLKKAEISGEDIGVGSKNVEDIAKVVNNFTGGARVGKIEGAVPFLNAMFFSPRKIASTINILNPYNYISPKISKTAKKASLRNLLGSLAITTSIIKLADLLGGDTTEIEEDPRSSDFGKIKVGDTRIDVSGGNANYAVLLSRLLSQETKSAQTGIINELGGKYGQATGFDLTTSFLRNKLSPNASLLVDIINKENVIGEKKSISKSLLDRVKPMYLNSLYELSKEDQDGRLFLSILGLFGAGLSTYSISEDWENKETKEIINFKEKVGDENFKKANNEYNSIIKNNINSIKKTDKYKNLSNEDKIKEINKIKNKAKKDIFSKYK